MDCRAGHFFHAFAGSGPVCNFVWNCFAVFYFIAGYKLIKKLDFNNLSTEGIFAFSLLCLFYFCFMILQADFGDIDSYSVINVWFGNSKASDWLMERCGWFAIGSLIALI